MMQDLHAVTGAFSYSGRHIAQKLLDAGMKVITLTNSPDKPDPFGDRVSVFPLSFGDPEGLARSLHGVAVLYNTYWVRFNHRDFGFAQAVANTKILFEAARSAGVQRIVHVSITNPSLDSPLEYFRGKAVLEEALESTGISHTILRPAVLFGGQDILINNMAWMIRTFPIMGMPGTGQYRMRPIHVDDLASLAVSQGQSQDTATIDAVGPESFAYRDLLGALCKVLGKRRLILLMPPWMVFVAGWGMGNLLGDVVLTRDEIRGLMGDLLHTDSPSTGVTKLSEWMRQNATTLGRTYASELSRRGQTQV